MLAMCAITSQFKTNKQTKRKEICAFGLKIIVSDTMAYYYQCSKEVTISETGQGILLY